MEYFDAIMEPVELGQNLGEGWEVLKIKEEEQAFETPSLYCNNLGTCMYRTVPGKAQRITAIKKHPVFKTETKTLTIRIS